MDWQGFVFDPKEAWIERLERRARRRFPDPTLAEEAYTYAFEVLSRDDWARLAGFEGRASPGTFLQSIFSSLLEDYSRKRFGRPRPPAWLKRMGTLWTRVWKLLCLECQDSAQIKAVFGSEGEEVFAVVEEALRVIKAKVPRCEEQVGEVPVETLPDPPSKDANDAFDPPDSRVGQGDLLETLHTVALLFDPSQSGSNPPAALVMLSKQMETSLGELQGQLAAATPDDDRLLLRLVFQEGVPIAEAARLLQMADHTARRNLRAVIRRLRTVLETFGIGSEVLG